MEVTNEIWPVSSDYYGTTALSTASSTPVSLTDSPSVTCFIGASGDCLLTISAYIGLPVTGDVTGTIYSVVDGGTPEQFCALGFTGAAALSADFSRTALQRL
ncbi:MAG: hypothetical protein WAM97_15520, partial [Acidimicrobiales bacterium]